MAWHTHGHQPVYGPEQPNPEPGTPVLYHGTKTSHHGLWFVLGTKYGRTVLGDPDTDETLTISAGNRTITVLVLVPLTCEEFASEAMGQLMDEISEHLEGEAYS